VLADYETRTGSQIAVLLVKSTEPEAIEQYSIRVADAWKLGRKGVDDGVLLLVARDNPSSLRRLRIEAGRGVQGVLTDAQSKRVLQDVIAPHFRKNDYYGGLVAGVGAISTLLNQEKFPAPAAGQAAAPAQEEDWRRDRCLASSSSVFGFMLLRSMFRRAARASRAAAGAAAPPASSSATSSAMQDGGGGGFGGGGGGFSAAAAFPAAAAAASTAAAPRETGNGTPQTRIVRPRQTRAAPLAQQPGTKPQRASRNRRWRPSPQAITAGEQTHRGEVR
jgi:uncharacterized protein